MKELIVLSAVVVIVLDCLRLEFVDVVLGTQADVFIYLREGRRSRRKRSCVTLPLWRQNPKSQMVREAGAAIPIFSPNLYFGPEPYFKMRWLSQWSKIYF